MWSALYLNSGNTPCCSVAKEECMADFLLHLLLKAAVIPFAAPGGGILGAVRAVREGLPIPVVDETVDADILSMAELDRLGIPHRRPGHQRGQGKLTPEQSDRLLRVVRIIREAEGTFGSRDKARRWLRRPTAALDGQAPLDLLDTEIGARSVEDLLGRIAQGIAA
jgi:putative toxin-antitoxin system antitoxin component (TIGR02293 family)